VGVGQDAKVEAQAYDVNLGQGKTILALLEEVDKLIEDDAGKNAQTILELARAMSNIGGKPA
jgi:translation initiation factor IF-2